MNMRQHKRNIQRRQAFNNWYDGVMLRLGDPVLDRAYAGPSRTGGIVIFDETPSPLGELLARRIREEELLAVEEAKVEFICVKVNGGDVVDTFDTREDALALVLKHAKQRKAKLQVIDSSTGELVLFSESEMA